jgi:hypothetical protein
MAHSVRLAALLRHIFISLNLVPAAWIASGDVLSDSIPKVADIAPSSYEVLGSFDFKVFTGPAVVTYLYQFFIRQGSLLHLVRCC